MASFLDLFTATDSAGVPAAKYRLHFRGNALHHQMSFICGIATDFFFAMYMMVAVPANALLGLVLSSGSWLQPLSDFYERVTAPFYSVFPPWAIACVGLAIVVVSMVGSKPTSTTGGLFNSESLNRLGVAAAMVVMVAILASNPFATIHNILDTVNGLSADFASKVTQSSNGTAFETGQALVDQSIRTPAIALNYGHEFSAECSQKWSEAMESDRSGGLSADSGCFVEGQNDATPLTAITALLMLIFPALPMLVFSAYAGWKYVVHLSMAVLSFVATAWVGAVKVHHRRGFDKVSENIARSGAHMALAVVISATAVAMPSLCSGIAEQILGTVTSSDAQAFLMMVTLGIGFAVSTWVIYRLTSNTSPLVRILKADANMTLEATLGIKPKKLSDLDFGFLRFNPLGRHSDTAGVELDSEKGAPKKGRVALASTEDEDMDETAAIEDRGAVKSLASTALAVAEQGSLGEAARTADTAIAAAQSAAQDAIHSNRIWQTAINQATNTVTINRVGDVYGYFTDETHGREVDAIDAEVVDVTYDDEVPETSAPQHGIAGTDPAEPESTGIPPQPQLPPVPEVQTQSTTAPPPEPSPQPVGGAGALAGAPSRSLDTAVPSTAGGNVYADPALSAVTEVVGAVFTTDVPVPAAVTVTSPLPGFSGGRFGSSSDVQHGPAVVVVDGVEVHEPSAVHDAAPPVNDQQRWNRASWRDRTADVASVEDVTSVDVEPELPLSGLVAGANRHPASFLAPMADFLAADELLAQKEEVELVHAAMGQSVVAVAPAGDSRLALRLSSDPEERVVRVCESEFGDPL